MRSGASRVVTSTDCSTTGGCGTPLLAVERVWRDEDIGAPRMGGASAWEGGVVAVAGSGFGFGQTSDEAHFTYARVQGDADIVARLLGIHDDHPQASAGLVIRSSLGIDASYAGLIETNSSGLSFERRLVDGWATLMTASPVTAPNLWMKLERRGSLVTSYVSLDGVTWITLGADTVDLEADAYVGFVAASRRESELTTATFDQVSITLVGEEVKDPPPTQPDVPPIDGGGVADPEPPVEQAPPPIDAGGSGSPPPPVVEEPAPTEPPPVIVVPAPPPVVVTDPPPATEPEPTPPATEPPAPDTSTPPTQVPTTFQDVVFEPSPDHDVNVSSYVFEVARADSGDVLLSQDIGKPLVDAGECHVDVSAFLQQLPIGSYVAMVKAVSPSGVSAAALSGVFSIQ